MNDAIKNVMHKKRGRPATGQGALLSIRYPDDMVSSIDAYAEKAGITRSAAVKRLVQDGLAANRKRKPPTE
jgi:metal-responsive CopG/Arc/MetJ family transcriptional regulator